jgi:hypothetical protein
MEMNQSGSLQTIKIVQYTNDPASGISEARRAGSFLNFQSLIRRGGVPSGAAAFIVTVE